MEHLLMRSKCSIFHDIFKTIAMWKIFFGKYLKKFELFIESDAMF